MTDIFDIELTKNAQKDLKNLPVFIIEKFFHWVKLVKQEGLRKARTVKGFHDEPLKGKRKGQRSVRLNGSYRAIYVEKLNSSIEFIEVQEVNNHDY